MHTSSPPLTVQQLRDLLRGVACPAPEAGAGWLPNLEGLRSSLGVTALRLTLVDAAGHTTATHLVPPDAAPWPPAAALHIPCQHGGRTLGILEVVREPGREETAEDRAALDLVADGLAREADLAAVRDSLGGADRAAAAVGRLHRELALGAAGEPLLPLLLHQALELTKAARGALYLPGTDSASLLLQAHYPAAEPPPPACIAVDGSGIDWAEQGASPGRPPTAATGEGEDPTLPADQLAVPLGATGTATGLLVLEAPGTSPFTDQERRLVTEFAAQATQALALARLLGDLREDRDLREDILAGTPNGVIAVDHQRRVLLVNATARQFFADPTQQPLQVGQPISQILPQQRFHERLDRVLSGASEREIFDLVQGTEEHHRDYLVNIFRLRRGELLAATVVVRDMTEQRRLNEQMLRIGRVASLGQLAAGIAHEIRNPLTGIGITLDILREEPGLSADAQEMITDISREIDRLEALIHGLLDFARPRQEEHRPMRLAKALEWHRTFREQCRNKGLVCRLELDANPKIAGDPERLKQLFLNLAINALDATEVGGTVTLRTGVETGTDGVERAQVEVSDTGRGMDPQTLEQVFDPFFTTKSEGTGLGLSIAHSIVEQHHGQIDVDSAPNRGTTFRVVLPVCGDGER